MARRSFTGTGSCRPRSQFVSRVAPRCWVRTPQETRSSTMNADLRIRSRYAGLLLACALVLTALSAHADDLRDGRTALAAGQYDRAIELFEKAASQGYAEGRSGVGQVYLRRRQYAKALEAFQLAQKMDNGLAWAYY